jgi:DNA-binding CsgD family transcriptional regulator
MFARILNPFYAVSASIAAYLLSSFLQIPILMVDAFASVVIVATLPLLSGLILLMAQRINAQAARPKAIGEKLFCDTAGKRNYLRSALMRLSVAMVLWCSAYEFIRTLYIQGGVHDVGATAYAYTQELSAFFTLGIVCIIGVGLFFNPKKFDMSYPYRAILLLSVTGIGLFAFSSTGLDLLLPCALHTGAWQSFGLAFWIITIILTGYQTSVSTKVFATARGFWALGGLIGIIAGRTLSAQVAASENLPTLCSLVCILLVLVSYLFIFNEKIVSGLTRFFPTKMPGRFNQKCNEVARVYRLSARETEVLRLLARGRNVEFIVNELTLSSATVCTHRQHIYQKMAIHSQQELLDVIERIAVSDAADPMDWEDRTKQEDIPSISHIDIELRAHTERVLYR